MMENIKEGRNQGLINLNFEKGMSDSHFHIMEMLRKGMDVLSLLETLQNRGFGVLLDAAVILDDFEERLIWTPRYDKLYFAAGLHPNIPRTSWPRDYKKILKTQLAHPRVKAAGETGLDFFRSDSIPEDQYEILNLHYELASEAEKPLIFHVREAEKAMTAWIRNRTFPSGGVLHCFSGDEALAEAALEKGLYISYAGNVTFKNAEKIRRSLQTIPLNRLLLETDAPYLCPHPFRGKNNHSGFIGLSYRTVAAELNIPLQKLINQTAVNLNRFLKLEEI